MERWRARSAPVQEHFESLEPALALRFVLFMWPASWALLPISRAAFKRGVLLL